MDCQITRLALHFISIGQPRDTRRAVIKIDGFAEATAKYSDFHTALNQFLLECNFKTDEKGQPSLFKGGGIL